MRKIQYLDGLRGLAAFVVVFHHFILAFYPALFSGSGIQTHLGAGTEDFISGSIFNLLYNGNFAVCIFFVLSGFVLSRKFFLKKDCEIITEGAVKRYLRLALPVAFSILVVYLLMKLSLFYNQQAAEVSGSYWLGGYWKFAPSLIDALNQSFIGAFFTNVLEYNATLWAIAVEFFGSFLVFGFLALFGKMKNRYLAYAFAIVYFFNSYYLAFIAGMLLSDLVAHKESIMTNVKGNRILRAGLLSVGIFLGSYPSGRAVDGTMYAFMRSTFLSDPVITYHILGAFLVILVLLESKRIQKIFSLKWLLFLGEISFAMYLLHFIILGSFSSFVFLKLAPHFSYAAAFWITFILSLVPIIILSYFMHLHVDARAVKFSKLIYLRIFKR